MASQNLKTPLNRYQALKRMLLVILAAVMCQSLTVVVKAGCLQRLSAHDGHHDGTHHISITFFCANSVMCVFEMLTFHRPFYKVTPICPRHTSTRGSPSTIHAYGLPSRSLWYPSNAASTMSTGRADMSTLCTTWAMLTLCTLRCRHCQAGGS